MQAMPQMIRRHAIDRVLRLFETFPVVAITGPRQVGKSTLAGEIVDRLGGLYRTMDDADTLSQALDDPQGFVTQTSRLLVIDEIQQVPEMMRAIKWTVDRDRRPGRFLITGSANLLRMRTITESLAGRSAWLELPPLTWSEMAGNPLLPVTDLAFDAGDSEEFIGRLPAGPASLADEARERAVRGGMPGTLHLKSPTRHEWYENYRQTFIERDLRQLSQIENLPEFVRLMRLVMVRSSGLLNRNTLASDSQLAYATLRRYLGILEVACQVYELPPFFVNVGKRLVKSPKLYAADSGMAAYASGISTWKDAVAQGRDGALLETWLVNELRALDALGSFRSTVQFWRTGAGAEVDLVLERGEAVVAIEFKAGATIGRREMSSMTSLREDLGPRFKLGIIAYLGEDLRTLTANTCLVPIPSLLGVVR